MNKLFLFLLTTTLLSCSNSDNKVTIAVANNMRYAIEEIAISFENAYKIKVEISSSSSGTLTTQIKQGAPFDIFISANMKYPNMLYKDGFSTEAPKTYAYGSLVLWTIKDIDIKKGLKSLLSPEIRKIAIANPETAPYGIAAIEALKNAGLHDTLNSKIIWGEGVGQINQYIQSESVDAGLTSKSVLYSPKIKNKGKSIDIKKDLYQPIQQGIIKLKSNKNIKNTELFFNYMFSEDVKEILTKFGYEVK